jgi:glycosyltransferase involved in cell wall biosynthesis
MTQPMSRSKPHKCSYRRYPPRDVKPVHPADRNLSKPAYRAHRDQTSDQHSGHQPAHYRALQRVRHVLFVGEHEQHSAAAPWLPDGLSRTWVTKRPLSNQGQQRLAHLIDPDRLTGMATVARSKAAQGCVVGVLFADGTLAAACCADPDARLAWQQATLSVGSSPETAGAEVVRQLLTTHRLVVVGTLDEHFSFVWPTPQDHPLRTPSVRRLLLSHLALALYAHDHDLLASLTPTGALRDALTAARTAPIDARFHLPPIDLFEHSRATSPPLPPDPDRDPNALIRWCQQPVTEGPFPVSRLLASIHRDRPDLTETYLDLSSVRDRIGLWKWVGNFGAAGDALPAWATRPPQPLPIEHVPKTRDLQPRATAVQVVGYLDAVLGLGEAARLVVRALEGCGESIETVTYRHLASDRTGWRERRRDGLARPDIAIFCLSGTALLRYLQGAELGSQSLPYRIGLWFHETTRLSEDMISGFAHVDEVWVTSEFTAAAVRASAPARVAVHVMPLGVRLTDTGTLTGLRQHRIAVGLRCDALAPFSDRPWCGFSFDLASRLIRKNPVGLIEAWIRAFPAPGKPVLVIKTMNGTENSDALETLLSAATARPDIVIINEAWRASLHHAFIRSLSVCASLHRSEGYGLLLLEALALGVPVMATGATGNLAFMNDTNSWLVPAHPTLLANNDGIYGAGDGVYEPDVQAASQLLRTLFSSDPEVITDVAQRSAQGMTDVAGLASGEAAAHWVARRLALIRATKR